MLRLFSFVILFALPFFAVDRTAAHLVPDLYRDFPDHLRFHSLGFSARMQEWQKMGGSEILIIGDSRTQNGLDPAALHPQAYNLASGSAGLDFQQELFQTPGILHPDLKLIIWGLSPRIFNGAWQDPVARTYALSPARTYLKQQAQLKTGPLTGWPAALSAVGFEKTFASLSAGFAHRSLIRAILLDQLDQGRRFRPEKPETVLAQGFTPVPEHQQRSFDAVERERYLESHGTGAFYPRPERLTQFRDQLDSLQGRGLKVYLFIPPMHPLLAKSGVADHDGTPRPDYRTLTRTLTELENSTLAFRDFHRAGDNDFADWDNRDHLNPTGAAHLAGLIQADLIKRKWISPLAAATENRSSTGLEGAQKKTRELPVKWTLTARALIHSAIGFLGGSLSAQTSDTTPPVLKINRAQNYTIVDMQTESHPLFRVDFQDSSGVDLSSARFFINEKDRTADIQLHPTHMLFRPTEDWATGLYRARFEIKDKAGNKATVTWDIMFQEC